MKSMVKKLKRYTLGVLLLPLCYGMAVGFWAILRPFRSVPEGSFYFMAGIFSYLAFQWVFFRPIRTYVFGHELSHALAAWMSGAKVKHFHVSKKGGSVTVTKSNFFVALAPYMLPLYALLFMAAYFILSYFYPILKNYWRLFLWLLGGTMGFHMALTAYALKMDQPDLKATGKFLSAVIIYIGNTVAIVFLLGVLFPRTVSWRRFASVSGREAFVAVQEVSKGTQVVWESAAKAMADPPGRPGGEAIHASQH
jgi:hypothetical protein